MANFNGPLKAVDCHSNSVRYDMVLSSAGGHPKLGLIRSPTTLQRRRYASKDDADTHLKSLSSGIHPSIISWPTLMGP
eukprot:scaffold11775_cov198-Skeletonema_marinoi.AAC.1